jgi:glycosyltransferase involved in cell wall biosynthesis
MGGAEDVLRVLARLYPQAPIYTSIYDRQRMPVEFRKWDIRSSWMNRLPLIHRHHQPYLPLYPLAFEGMDLSGYDVVLSNKSGFCHGVRTGKAVHICYCLTPTRYVWGFDDYASAEGLGAGARLALWPLVAALRRWDRAAASRVHNFVAISRAVQERIWRFYGRDSVVIYPPVDTSHFQPITETGHYYLCLGRLIPYKRVDLAVKACTRLGRSLKVAGSGRDRERLERLSGGGVEFLGRVPDADVPRLMASCRAFIFPGLEDFGIAPIQAMAAGRPVIAFAGGGAVDTVVDGVTGVLFHEQTSEALGAAIQRFEKLHFDCSLIRRHAQGFDVSVFEEKIIAFIEKQCSVHKRSRE